MKIYIGLHRIVVIIGSLVFKVPRVKLIQVLKERFVRWEINIKDYLFEGLLENYREIHCWFTTKHKLLIPVCIPFLIINVYPKVQGIGKLNINDEALVRDISKKEKDRGYFRAFYRCSHTFDDKENFAFDGKSVRIVDYGEDGVEELLLKYGDKVEKSLLSTVH